MDQQHLIDKLWSAVTLTKDREAKAEFDEERMLYRGKWLAFTEVALYLEGAFDFPGQQLEMNFLDAKLKFKR